MRRQLVLVVAVSVLTVFGCEEQKRDEIPQLDLAELQVEDTGEGEPPVVVEDERIELRPPAETPTPQTYTMKPGDTLYTLARRFYDDGKLWTKIYEANRDKIRDVADIPVGTVLVIPPK